MKNNIEEVIKKEYMHEFNTNKNIKVGTIFNLLNSILENQKIIMEKLNIK